MILENISTGKIFETLAISFFVCLLLVPLMTRFAIRVGLVDVPNSAPHKLHDRVIPVSGGLTYAVSLLIGSIFNYERLGSQLIVLLLVSLIIFAFGLWDDFRPLSVPMKLAGQFAAAILLYALNIRVHLFESFGLLLSFPPALITLLNFLTTIFWLVLVTNAYNLVDSMDGLMIGLSDIALLFFLVAGMDAMQFNLGLLCAAMLGAGIALTFFNSSPAFLFLGDSGAQTIGFLLGAIAILYDPPDRVQYSTWFMPVLLLAVPIFDAVLVTVSRVKHKKHFYTAGVDHTYHRLTRHGFSSVQSVQFMQLAAVGLEILAFFAISQSTFTANLMFFIIVTLGILAIILLESDLPWTIKTLFHGKNN